MATKRVVAIGDLHCGHRAGLTPPSYRFRECSEDHIWKKFTAIQKEAWDHYVKCVEALLPVDCLIVNGDLIDGRGEKSGGVELVTADRNEQCQMATDCIVVWKSPVVIITEGTPYHAGEIESWEHIVADKVQSCDDYKPMVKVGAHEWVDVNGYVFDVKHHIGGSQVPHGRHTALARDEVWNLLWNEAGLQPRGNMILRSHVHYCVGGWRYIGSKRVDFMTLPALQSMGTRFGARRMSGTVDWGLYAWDIDDNGLIVSQHAFVITLESTKAKLHRV